MSEPLSAEQFEKIVQESVLESAFLPDLETIHQLGEYIKRVNPALESQIDRIMEKCDKNIMHGFDELGSFLLQARRSRR